jgi:hypothetical protein
MPGRRTRIEGERAQRDGKPAALVRRDYPCLLLRLAPKRMKRLRQCADMCEVSMAAFTDAAIDAMCDRVERREQKQQKEGNDHE